MKRVLSLFFAFASFACATAQTPTATPAATPAATATPVAEATAAQPPCDPGVSILNATLWMQTSAEYRAVALQTFHAAQRGLDQAIRNPFAIGALEEQSSNDPTQPMAIILDLDETVLDNSAFETRAIRMHKTYDSKTWKSWVAESAARAIPGAADFLAYAKSKGVTPFYITNRDFEDEGEGTLKNLQQLGFPLDPNVDTLLMKGENGWTTSDKSPRRAHVAKSYRVLLLLGDDLNDFITTTDKTVAEREKLVDSVRAWWGEVFFLVPNPMYGTWERASISRGGTDCEQLQKKIDVLRDK